MSFSISDLFTPEMLGSIVRSGLMAIGVDKFLSGDQVTSIAGAVAVFIAVGWSLVQKKMAADKKHDAVSAAARMVAYGVADPDHVTALSKAGIL